MKKIALILIILWGTAPNGNSQEEPISDETIREVAFNMTTLTKKLMPFNPGAGDFQRYAMQFRRRVPGNRLYLVSGFGFNMSTGPAEDNLFHFDLKAGFETRRKFAKKWYFASGYNLALFSHEIEENTFFGGDVDAGLLFDKSFLIAYRFNEHISLFAETSLRFGLSVNTVFKMEFLPPGSIFLNVTF